MPTDSITATTKARANYKYLAEAQDEDHLSKLKAGAHGYNQSLHAAKLIDDHQLQRLTTELDATCAARREYLESRG